MALEPRHLVLQIELLLNLAPPFCAKAAAEPRIGKKLSNGIRERCGDDLGAMARELEVSRKGLQQRMKEIGLT